MNTSPATLTVGTPAAGILTYTATAVRSLAVEAARAAAAEDAKGIASDAWAAAVLIGDAVLMVPDQTAVTRAAIFNTAAAAAADAFADARRTFTGDKETKGWPAFATARSTIGNGLHFGVYAPGLSKSATAKAVKAAKAALSAHFTNVAQEYGLMHSEVHGMGEAATALAAARREAAEAREELARLQSTMQAMRDAHAAQLERATAA